MPLLMPPAKDCWALTEIPALAAPVMVPVLVIPPVNVLPVVTSTPLDVAVMEPPLLIAPVKVPTCTRCRSPNC